jgi:class 3 adenylate cyclase
MTVTVTPRKGRRLATGKSHPAVGSRVGVPSGLKKGWSSREVTVLLTDLRGFSAIADSISGRDMLAVLNRYLTQMCEIAIANGGSIDKFIGDAVMVLFGAPHRLASHARRAVTCALQMQLAMDEINRDNKARGHPRRDQACAQE